MTFSPSDSGFETQPISLRFHGQQAKGMVFSVNLVSPAPLSISYHRSLLYDESLGPSSSW